MISIRYIPAILAGIIVIIGLNTFADIRDNKMWDKLDQRNNQITTSIHHTN